MRTMRKHRLGTPVSGSARGRRSRTSGRSGFTIIEVMVAVTVLVIAVVGIVGSMLSSMALNRVNRETAIAQQAARRMMEEVSGVPFRDTFVIYNTVVGDDGAASMPERGADFAVLGLQPQNGDPDGMCGRIVFPVFDNGMGLIQVSENVVDVGLAMPADLNGDGDTTDTFTADYRLLPVRVLVEWRGVSGNRSIELESMLSQR